jgi:response regulator RpfG family c-di-GMP phosphodiesterase
MMDSEALKVLLALLATTGAMLYYARVYLPAKLQERTRESMKAFSTAVELRFPVREGLSNRVVSLSRELGKRLEFRASELRRIETSARLRDIGLCAIPYRLINDKPMSDWSDGDEAIYERHPEVGAAMLELVPSLSHLAPIVRCHQVNFDGSSGPFFPSKEDIPREARVLRVVSDYVWLERTQGMLLAREGLREGSGKLYDPEIVASLLAMLTSTRVPEPTQPVLV